MSEKKPGLFGRLGRAIRSTLDDAVEAVSDPGQELALMLDDLAAEIQRAEKDLKQAIVDRKVMERKAQELEKEVQSWTARAEQALKLGDETLARACLERKAEHAARLADAKVALIEQAKLVDSMGEGIKASKEKLKALNLRRGTLVAQARATKKAENAGVPGGSLAQGVSARMDAIEAQIAQVEAMNEVHAEFESRTAEEAELERKLKALSADASGGSELDAELAALKAKMGAAALPAASTESDD